MASHTLVYRSTYPYRFLTRELIAQTTKSVRHILPRRCMIVSVGMLLAGLSIPILMGLAIIPASLFVGFLGMVSACIGIVLTFYYM